MRRARWCGVLLLVFAPTGCAGGEYRVWERETDMPAQPPWLTFEVGFSPSRYRSTPILVGAPSFGPQAKEGRDIASSVQDVVAGSIVREFGWTKVTKSDVGAPGALDESRFPPLPSKWAEIGKAKSVDGVVGISIASYRDRDDLQLRPAQIVLNVDFIETATATSLWRVARTFEGTSKTESLSDVVTSEIPMAFNTARDIMDKLRRAAGQTVPLVAITAPASGAETDKVSLPFSVTTAYRDGIDQVTATNRKSGRTTSLYEAKDERLALVSVSRSVLLEVGRNEIEVIAKGSDGTQGTNRITVTRTAPRERAWLVAIAPNSSIDEMRALETEWAKNADAAEAVILVGEQATGRNIGKALDQARVDAGPLDRTIVFFAGRVVVKESTLYLVPADGDVQYESTLIAAPRLAASTDFGLGAIVVVDGIDGCTLGQGGRPLPIASGRTGFLIRIRPCQSPTVFPGSTAALMSRGVGGAADGDRDGAVTAGELAAFMKAGSPESEWLDFMGRRDLLISRGKK